MSDQSMEELREFVNNYRIKNYDESHTSNGSTKHYTDDELIKILESDTLNIEERNEASALHRTEKSLEKDSREQIGYNVWKVTKNGVEGLTLEIRESLYSKLSSALSINYTTTFDKKTILTESSICNIAKKIEFSILSIALDLNSYKLSGAEKVVHIERETHNKSLCEALRAEIELLRLRDETQTTMSKDNPQQLSSDLSVEAESILHQESARQDDQSNTESMTIDTAGDRSIESPVFPTTFEGDSEYFSCSPVDHRSIETQQSNESCISNNNTRDPVMHVGEKEKLNETESTKNEEFQSIATTESISICKNNNHVEKNATEPSNVLSEVHSSNGTDKIDLPSTDGVSQSQKRKRKSESDLEPPSISLPGHRDKENTILNTCTKNNPPNKKHKGMESETTLDTCDITTYYFVDCNNIETFETRLPQVTLEGTMNARKTGHDAANGTPFIENIKIEPEDNKIGSFPPTLTNYYNKENSSSNKTPHEKCDRFDKNENVISSDRINVLPNKINQLEIKSSDECANLSLKVRYRIKSEVDVSRYSMCIDDKENIDKFIDSIVLKNENASSVDTDSSDALKGDKVLQNFVLNSEKNAISSLDTSTNPETTVVEDRNVSDSNPNNDCHPKKIVESRCLTPEKAFEREKARLNNEHKKMKRAKSIAKLRPTEKIENESCLLSHDDCKNIFEIIVPIMREYYPSQYIATEYSYGKILQRLQIHLSNVVMSDAEMASYSRDSIETMRYLCDHCMVQ